MAVLIWTANGMDVHAHNSAGRIHAGFRHEDSFGGLVGRRSFFRIETRVQQRLAKARELVDATRFASR